MAAVPIRAVTSGAGKIRAFCLACLLALTLSTTLLAEPVPERRLYRPPDRSFTFEIPEDWVAAPHPEEPLPVVYGPQHPRFTPTITLVVTDKAPGTFFDFVDASERDLKESGAFNVGRHAIFLTRDGLPAVKLSAKVFVDDWLYRQFFYFFSGPGSRRYIAIACCGEEEARNLEPLFDAALRSWRLTPPPAKDTPDKPKTQPPPRRR